MFLKHKNLINHVKIHDNQRLKKTIKAVIVKIKKRKKLKNFKKCEECKIYIKVRNVSSHLNSYEHMLNAINHN